MFGDRAPRIFRYQRVLRMTKKVLARESAVSPEKLGESPHFGRIDCTAKFLQERDR